MRQTKSWKKVCQDERLQRSSVCASVVGSTVYIFGGELKPRQPRDNDLHKIDLTESGTAANVQTIPASKDSPSPRVGAATTALHGRVYLFSGRGGEAMAPVDEKGHLWVLDPLNDGWRLLSPKSSNYPEARSYHCMTSDGDDTIYLHAGCPEKGRMSDLWAFSIAKAEWKLLTPAPDPPRGGPSIAFVDDKIYRAGGFDGKTAQGGHLDVFDPTTNCWSSIDYKADGTSGPGPRSVSALVPVRSNGSTSLVTLFGESDPSALGHQGAGKFFDDIWAYSLEEGKWLQITFEGGEAPEARGWFDADVVTVDGKDGVVVVGGLGESNDRHNDVWLLTL